MKVIPIMATKGGTGKTKICVELSRALKAKGYKVGILDMDWSAPKITVELGIDKNPSLILESGVGDTIKPVISPEGFPVISSSFIFPPDQAISMDEESKIKDVAEIISPGVVDWGDVDYLIMDTPPTTARFVHTALTIQGLHGVILVTQPAKASLTDLLRTVSLLRDLHVPLLGLVGNQVYVLCPHGDKVSLYDLQEEDIVAFCRLHEVPYLGSIPHVIPSTGFPTLNGIADSVISSVPIYLPSHAVSSIPYKLVLAVARRFSNRGG